MRDRGSAGIAHGESLLVRHHRSALYLIGALVLMVLVWLGGYSGLVPLEDQSRSAWEVVGVILQLTLSALIATQANLVLVPPSWRKQQEYRFRAHQKTIADCIVAQHKFPRDGLECLAKCALGESGAHQMHEQLDDLQKLCKTAEGSGRVSRFQSLRWHQVARALRGYVRFADMCQSGHYGPDIRQCGEENCAGVDVSEISCLYDEVQALLKRVNRLACRPKWTWAILFFAVFALIHVASGLALGRVHTQWLAFVAPIVAIVPVTFAILYPGQLVARRLTETTQSEIDDVLVSFVLVPLIAGVALALLYLAAEYVPASLGATIDTISSLWSFAAATGLLPGLVLTVVALWTATFAWRFVIIRGLRRLARLTQQKQDDVFVELIYWLGNLVLVAIALGIISGMVLLNIDPDIPTRDILYPFAIMFSTGAFVLGYSTRETLENFFAGVLLQIDRPFEIGERLVLGSGEICDVRGFGMRSTTLYNVLENTEMSVPNKMLSNMIITNISRPDSQLRIQVHAYVSQGLTEGWTPGEKIANSERAEAVLLKAAYCDREISHVFVDAPADYQGPRDGIRELLKSIAERHRTQIANQIKDQLLGDRGPVKEFEDHQRKIIDTEDRRRLKLYEFRELSQRFAVMSREVYALKERFPELHTDMDSLLNELSHEPVVFSEPEVSEDGVPYIKVSLNCFAKYLERRYEVSHRLVGAIQREFENENILYRDLGAVP